MSALPPISKRRISIHLDDGVDSAELSEADVMISRLGMILRSRWCFSLGTQLRIHIQASVPTERRDYVKIRLEGIVVDCETDSEQLNHYRTTLLFMEEQ